MTDLVALAEEGKRPDSMEQVKADVVGELLPMIDVMLSAPTQRQYSLLLDELEDLYVRVYNLRGANDVS